MDDETLLKTMKNGLMIAGHEMGPVGDHWPAINVVSKGLDEEFETMRRNEAVVGELEFHVAEAIRQLEEGAEELPEEEYRKVKEFARRAWEHYYSVFDPVAPGHEPDVDDLLTDEEKDSIKSISATIRILKGLGGRA